MAELQAAIAEQSRRREEAIHALETMQREREHAAEVERSKLQAKLTDVSEDVTRKIMARDMKLREETQDKFGQLQQVSTVYSTLIHTPFHLAAACSHRLVKYCPNVCGCVMSVDRGRTGVKKEGGASVAGRVSAAVSCRQGQGQR